MKQIFFNLFLLKITRQRKLLDGGFIALLERMETAFITGSAP